MLQINCNSKTIRQSIMSNKLNSDSCQSSEVSSTSLSTPRNRNPHDGENVTPTRRNTTYKPHSISNLFSPNDINFIDQKSFIKQMTISEGVQFQRLEEIKEANKFHFCFELFRLKLYPDQDLAVLKVRDGTLLPSQILCFPNYSDWDEVKCSIIQNPIYRSNEPIVDLLLYNSSFEILKLKELFNYCMKNVMVIKTVGGKGFVLCADAKNTYLSKVLSQSEQGSTILRKLADKKYQELEEKYVQSLNNLEIIQPHNQTTNSPLRKRRNIVKESNTSVLKETNKNGQPSSKEDNSEEEDSSPSKKAKIEVYKYKSLSELTRNFSCVNTFGVIKNILKDQGINKWRVTVEIVDQIKEKPFKVHLFLQQLVLKSLIRVMKKYQIIELRGMKVMKCHNSISGSVFAGKSSIALYSSVTGDSIAWNDTSSICKPSESALKIIECLRTWTIKTFILSKDNVNNKEENTKTNLSLHENQLNLSNSKRLLKRKSKDEEESNLFKEEEESDMYSILNEIVLKKTIIETNNEIIPRFLVTFEDITEDMKFNSGFQILNIHHYSEINVDVIQVRDMTLCPIPVLHIPLANSWTEAKKIILNKPFYSCDSPILDIMCFESMPYLPPLQIGNFYKFNSITALKTQLPVSSENEVGYLMCVQCKDCDAVNKRKTKDEIARNETNNIAAEASFLNSVFQQHKDTVYYPDFLRPIIKDADNNVSKPLEEVEDDVEKALLLLFNKAEENGQNPNIGEEMSTDSKTPSLIDLDRTDGINTEVHPDIAREIDSMMQEESALGLHVTMSEDVHLRNTGSEPTYSQFVKCKNEKNKMYKTSTQELEIKDLFCTLSTDDGINNAKNVQTDLTSNKDQPVHNLDSFKSNNKDKSEFTDNKNSNDVNDSHSYAGSESILTNYKQNLNELNEKQELDKKKLTDKDISDQTNEEICSDDEVILLKENISPEKVNRRSLLRKPTGIIEPSVHNKQPDLLINALLVGVTLPSYCFYNNCQSQNCSSDDIEEEKSEGEGDVSGESLDTSDNETSVTTMTKNSQLPIISIRQLLQTKTSSSTKYTVIPLKLSPQLEDGWEEECVKCTCNKCNETFTLKNLKKIPTEVSSNWPNQRVPVCSKTECKMEPIEIKTAHFYFEIELNFVKFKHTGTAILTAESAETFLDCSVVDFLNCEEKRLQVKARLNHVFVQNSMHDSNVYSFTVTRKNLFDIDSGPLYVTNIELK